MNLSQYPEAIAETQKMLIRLNHEVIQLTETCKFLEAEMDKAIAADSTLKNDAQRKAEQTDPDYYQASIKLKEGKLERDLLDVELERLRSLFSIAKLDKRQRIVEMEIQVAVA